MSNLTIDVLTADGTKNGQIELPAEIFDREASIPLMHQVVTAYLAGKRQGTHSTKTRAEVSGGGKKPFRQKGTGRARQGSIRAPHFKGGGISHGPKPRNYAQRTPKKMKAAALRGALTDRVKNDRIHVVEELVTGQTPSTKKAKALLGKISERKNLLVVLPREDVTSWRSARNLENVAIVTEDQLTTYAVLKSDDVIFSVASLKTFIDRATKSEEK